MKTKRERAFPPLAVALGLILCLSETGTAQVRGVAVDACPQGMEEGSLGITGLDCVGECTLTIQEGGTERSWSFSVEPRVIGIERRGPADGLLQIGDYLVAIDGLLITTREGGRRYANLEPGERVEVRFRRDGRMGVATIRVATRCRATLEPLAEVSRVPPPPPPEPDTLRRAVGIAVSPRVRVATAVAGRVVGGDSLHVGVVEGVSGISTVSRRGTLGLLSADSPSGRLGIGFSCNQCGVETDQSTGEDVWFFSGPLEVTAVTPDSPAHKAGILRGDLIKAIDGRGIDTEEGGLAYSRLTPGVGVRLTVVKRNGSEEEVSVVPEEAVSVGRAREPTVASGAGERRAVGVGAGEVARARRVDAAPSPPPVSPDTTAVPRPATNLEPPPDLPLRYSGTMDGVEVEVRGDPVTVAEVVGARTIYINAEGLWIRITVPRRR